MIACDRNQLTKTQVFRADWRCIFQMFGHGGDPQST
jgi:hypothetical protein